MNYRPLLLAVAVLVPLGCDKKESTSGGASDKAGGVLGDMASKAGEAAKEAGGKINDAVKSGQAGMADKLSEMLAQWKPTVESLKSKAASAPEAVKPQIESAIKTIEQQWSVVEGHLSKLKSSATTELQSAGTEAFAGAEKLGDMIKDAAGKYLK